MKVVIAGGTGQIGQILCRDFVAKRWQVVVLSRRPMASGERHLASSGGQLVSDERHRRADVPVRVVAWDAEPSSDAAQPNVATWQDEIDGSDVVINLAGRSVDCRYNKQNQAAIMNSRLDSTRAIVESIAAAVDPPKLLLQASTATIYSHRYDSPNDDVDGMIGGSEPDAPDKWRFSIDVATAWEDAAMEIDLPKTRRVLMRSAITLSPDRGGIFEVLLRLVRFGLGGNCAGGRQFVSWIHDSDFVAAVHWLIEHQQLSGPINLSSPQPIPQSEFNQVLRRAWGQPLGLPATRWMLRLGAVLMRTETELVLKSRRVYPTRLIESGFQFQFPNWQAAATDLCRRIKSPAGTESG